MMQTTKFEGEECEELRVCFEVLDRVGLRGSCNSFLSFGSVRGFDTCGGEAEIAIRM